MFKTILLAAVASALMASEPRKFTDIEYARPDGVSLKLDAYVPEGAGPFLAVIVVHGGGWTNGDKNTYVKPLFGPLNDSGFTWFTIDYRLAPQYKWPAQAEDVDAAIRWVRAHAREYKVDTKRIALMGESAGGHLVGYAGARNKNIAAVVDFYGPSDLERRSVDAGKLSPNIEKLFDIHDLSEASRKILRDASPISYAHKGMPPFLFIHGTADKTVPYDQSTTFCARMKEVGAQCEVFSVEGAAHGVGGWEKSPDWQKYKTVMIAWLKSTLLK